jgi:serine/threonine protein phosphatase 1
LIAIGDVHGCALALETLLEAILPASADTLVFLGDLIDQGRDSAAVIEQILALQKICKVVLIQGNHEEMLVAARESEEALRYWEHCGGVQTLNSYRFGGTLRDIPIEHWELLQSCQPWFETDDFIFTHANYIADLPIADHPEFQLRWALFEPEQMQPHRSGKTMVVGHTETHDSEILDLGYAICIDTACWRHGWLTALNCRDRTCWQASRWGVLREPQEPAHRSLFSQLSCRGEERSAGRGGAEWTGGE